MSKYKDRIATQDGMVDFTEEEWQVERTKKRDLTKDADAVLESLQARGLDEEQAALVAAAVLCAITDGEDAHKFVAYINHCASECGKEATWLP